MIGLAIEMVAILVLLRDLGFNVNPYLIGMILAFVLTFIAMRYYPIE